MGAQSYLELGVRGADERGESVAILTVSARTPRACPVLSQTRKQLRSSEVEGPRGTLQCGRDGSGVCLLAKFDL